MARAAAEGARVSSCNNMAWDIPSQGTPYYRPVAPEVPAPDNTAARIISAGTPVAIEAFTRMAIARENARNEQAKMLQDADLAAKKLQFDYKKQGDDYNVAKENADSLEQSRKDLAQWHQDTVDERSETLKNKLNATLAAQDAVTNWEKGIASNDAAAVNDLKGISPELMKSNPGEFIVQSNDWNLKHGDAKVGAVPALQSRLSKQVNSLTIPFVPNAQYVTADGKDTGKPEDLQWRVPATNGKWIPASSQVGQANLVDIYHKYQDEQNRQAIMKGIIAAGHGSVVHQTDPKLGKVAVPTLDKYAAGILGSFGKQRETPASQTPPGLMYTTHPKWSINAGGGTESDMPSTAPDPADERQKREEDYARGLISTNPGRADAIKSVFFRKYPDADPNTFDYGQ